MLISAGLFIFRLTPSSKLRRLEQPADINLRIGFDSGPLANPDIITTAHKYFFDWAENSFMCVIVRIYERNTVYVGKAVYYDN